MPLHSTSTRRRVGPPGIQREGAGGPGLIPRRLLGLVLAALSVLPIYRLLGRPETGTAGEATIEILDVYHDVLVSGMLLLPIIFLLGAIIVPRSFEDRLAAAGRRLAAVPPVRMALGLAFLSAILGAVFVSVVLEGLPNLIDAQAQLLHARYMAAGRLTGPADDLGGFWAIQNSLFTERGWVSQYPPGHVGVLALFIRLGVPWLAGPLLMGATVFFAVLAGRRLLPEQPAVALLGAFVLAVSPFFIAIGASYMNHISAAAGVTAGAYGLVRAWQGRAAWGLLAGAGFGFGFMSRPLSTLAMAAALALLMPVTAPPPERVRRFITTGLFVAIGAAPFVGALMAYNAWLFGGPTTFGYNIAQGPRMSLGFHQDPWGNTYGITEAVAYTSSDLLALGLNLLESPLSAVLIVGLFLLVQPRIAPGAVVLLGWALAPVVSNFFYWHHGIFMGPRMLHEAAPAWALLFAVAATGLVQRVPAAARAGALSIRHGLLMMMIGGGLLGAVVLAPKRLASYGGEFLPSMRVPVPPVPDSALVFVHDSWGSRVAMTLASRGYRLDTMETLLRQNSLCRVHHLAQAAFARDRTAERHVLARLDTIPDPARTAPIVQYAAGVGFRSHPGEVLDSDCMRHAAADVRGNLLLEPLLWRGALPGDAGGIRYVRDLGPERNRIMMDRYPERTPYIYTARDVVTASPLLLPYDDGVRMLWGSTSHTHQE